MDYQKAASYWAEKDKTAVKLDRETLLQAIEAFLQAHNTCALATGYGTQVRCTPIEYTWLDHRFWLFSEGGKKFLALEKNKRVCLAIFDPYTGFGSLGGMQVDGIADLVEPWSADYQKLLDQKGVENRKKWADTLHLIRVKPTRIDFLSAALRKQGVSARQQIRFD